MKRRILEFDDAIRLADRQKIQATLAPYEEQVAEIRRRFPLERWPNMRLENYAIGHEASADSFGRWIEFQSPDIGSIKGGSAHKHIIFKRKNQPGWFFPKEFANVQEAWNALREDFVKSFSLVRENRWDEAAMLMPMQKGPALATKALHIYFPLHLLPIFSADHLRHFLRALGRPPEEVGDSTTVALNRHLLTALHAHPELVTWTTKELERLLYGWNAPDEAQRAVKIAPGREAKYWDECLEGGYICVGWGETGDLNAFTSKAEFKERFQQLFPYDGNSRQASRKANELWTLQDMRPGDLVVANRGIAEVLAVGSVVSPGYQWRPDRTDYPHTVAVDWDTSYAKAIEPQKGWALVTVAKVPDELLEAILKPGASLPPAGGSAATTITPVDPTYRRVASALDRKQQVVLYGPPGTGKTYTARRFAVWWLLNKRADPDAASVLADSKLFASRERELTAPKPNGDPAELTFLTFHPSYAYEDFIEGFRPFDAGTGALNLRLEDGVFKRICRAAEANPKRPYLLIVDEFNRANVAKVFGELLTLLESDKRGLTVSLPQSKQAFTVPANVFLVGTMNTADRSIKLLDAAFRRRFAFIELMPDSELLAGATIGDLTLNDLLEGLNERLAKSEGREKQIGHSYFMRGAAPIEDVDEFAARFREEILPLLQEYCYAEYGTLAKYLGNELVNAEARTLNTDILDDPEQLVAALAREFSDEPEQPEKEGP